MLKASCTKKRPAPSAPTLTASVHPYYGTRPTGSASFALVNEIAAWAAGDQQSFPPCSAVTRKMDGFQIVVDYTHAQCTYLLLSKTGKEFRKMESSKFKKLDATMRKLFRQVFKTGQDMKHPRAGKLLRFYAELVQDDGHGDSLQALMQGDSNPTGLFVFDCDFANDVTAKVLLAEKLAYLRRIIGPDHVVETIIDARQRVTEAHIENLMDVMATTEGIVARCFNKKTTANTHRRDWQETVKRIKHKASLPVPLDLLGVGFTDIVSTTGCATPSIPTHFVWGIKTMKGHYAVVLIDNKGHLCDPVRREQHKMHIDSAQFVRMGEGFECTSKTIAGMNYNALLQMAPLLTAAAKLDKRQAVVGGYTYTIDPNRSFSFESAAAFRFLPVPAAGVVGANRLWLTGKVKGPGSIHFQAPQFLASLNYGEPIFRMLIQDETIEPLTAQNLVHLASIRRDAREHARTVYWPMTWVDLVCGKVEEDDDDDDDKTPQHSDDETEAAYRAKVWDYDANKRAKREQAGLPSLMDTLSG
jgi:hypothetical protein